MDGLGISSFSLGTSNLNNIGSTGAHLIGNSLAAEAQTLGIPVSTNRRQLIAASSISKAGSATAGRGMLITSTVNCARMLVTNNVYTPNYNLALDAVRVLAANAGTSGLPIGSIACRLTLTRPGEWLPAAESVRHRRGVQPPPSITSTGPRATGMIISWRF